MEIWDYCWPLQWVLRRHYCLRDREMFLVPVSMTGLSSACISGVRRRTADGPCRSLMQEIGTWILQASNRIASRLKCYANLHRKLVFMGLMISSFDPYVWTRFSFGGLKCWYKLKWELLSNHAFQFLRIIISFFAILSNYILPHFHNFENILKLKYNEEYIKLFITINVKHIVL